MNEFRSSTELRVRLPETDAFGIVFHGTFYTYFDVARVDYLRGLGLTDPMRPTGGPNLIVHASADFKSPARFDDVLVASARIGEIGRTSFRFEFAVHHKAESRLVAKGTTVHVAIDSQSGRPAPVPESFRRAVRALEGANLVERT
jgi:acyl-CoA thioester hydrolase